MAGVKYTVLSAVLVANGQRCSSMGGRQHRASNPPSPGRMKAGTPHPLEVLVGEAIALCRRVIERVGHGGGGGGLQEQHGHRRPLNTCV